MILEIWKLACSVVWRCVVGSVVCNVSTERNAVIYRGWWLKSSTFYDKYSTFLRNVMKHYQLHGVTIRTYELPCKTLTWDPHFQCSVYIRHKVLSVLILPSLFRTRAARFSPLLLFHSQLSALSFSSTLQTSSDVVRSISWPYKVWWQSNLQNLSLCNFSNRNFPSFLFGSNVFPQHTLHEHHRHVFFFT
jgi:hypothetical protein